MVLASLRFALPFFFFFSHGLIINIKSACFYLYHFFISSTYFFTSLIKISNILYGRYATLCIRENPGCLFIATNRDAVGHFTDLQEWPGFLRASIFMFIYLSGAHFHEIYFSMGTGAGCMVAAICGSTQREPIVVGKPSTFVMDFLLERYTTYLQSKMY